MIELDIGSPEPVHPVHYGLEVALHQEFQGADVSTKLRQIEIEGLRELQLHPLLVNGLCFDVQKGEDPSDQQDRLLFFLSDLFIVLEQVIGTLILHVGVCGLHVQASWEEDFQHFQEDQNRFLVVLLHAL